MKTMPDYEAIDAIPAGPEIDRLVAERVMRWIPSEDPRWWADSHPRDCIALRSWSPSTNIAHAWQVMEVLIDQGRAPDLHVRRDVDPWRRLWLAGSARADTAPLVICRAGLIAVGYAP